MTRRRPSRLGIVGRSSALSSLSLRSTPFGAYGLDRASGPPRTGHYVMAGDAHRDINSASNRKEGVMNVRRHTPTIEIAIGRDVRLYHAYVTTAPAKLDAPATLTVHAAPLCDVLWMAAAFIAFDAERARQPGRLVLVDDRQLEWQQAKYKEAQHLFTPADPVLVGLPTLQDWLWNRLGAPHPDLMTAQG